MEIDSSSSLPHDVAAKAAADAKPPNKAGGASVRLPRKGDRVLYCWQYEDGNGHALYIELQKGIVRAIPRSQRRSKVRRRLSVDWEDGTGEDRSDAVFDLSNVRMSPSKKDEWTLLPPVPAQDDRSRRDAALSLTPVPAHGGGNTVTPESGAASHAASASAVSPEEKTRARHMALVSQAKQLLLQFEHDMSKVYPRVESTKCDGQAYVLWGELTEPLKRALRTELYPLYCELIAALDRDNCDNSDSASAVSDDKKIEWGRCDSCLAWRKVCTSPRGHLPFICNMVRKDCCLGAVDGKDTEPIEIDYNEWWVNAPLEWFPKELATLADALALPDTAAVVLMDCEPPAPEPPAPEKLAPGKAKCPACGCIVDFNGDLRLSKHQGCSFNHIPDGLGRQRKGAFTADEIATIMAAMERAGEALGVRKPLELAKATTGQRGSMHNRYWMRVSAETDYKFSAEILFSFYQRFVRARKARYENDAFVFDKESTAALVRVRLENLAETWATVRDRTGIPQSVSLDMVRHVFNCNDPRYDQRSVTKGESAALNALLDSEIAGASKVTTEQASAVLNRDRGENNKRSSFWCSRRLRHTRECRKRKCARQKRKRDEQ